MSKFIRFGLVLAVKWVSAVFYRFDVRWADGREFRFQDVRLGILLNHTSLYEPIFLRLVPHKILWRLAADGTFPGADKTMNRPLTGLFFRMLARRPVSITRKRDETWSDFTDLLDDHSLVIMAPEGRMKRSTGFDLSGKPLTVRGGIVDVLAQMNTGRMIVLHSGGLHHVQHPGEWIPRIFKKVKATIESLDISEYKAGFPAENFKQAVIADLEARRDRYCQQMAAAT